MSKIKKILAAKTPILMVSDSNYTTVTFSDGSKSLLSYCQKAIHERFGIKLKTVCRGVSADPDFSEVSAEGVLVLGQKFFFSRRIAKKWLVAGIVFCNTLIGFCQSPPVANPDVFYDCIRRPILIDVLANDNWSGIPLRQIIDLSVPTAGSVVLSGNKLRYTWGASDSTSFSYRWTHPYWGTSNFTTVKIYGRDVQNFAGDYTNTANLVVNGCRMLNRGKWTIKSTAKVQLQSNTSVTLLPGATIESGAVVDIRIVRP